MGVAGRGDAVARVFVSYASKDLALSYEVHGWLVEAGHEVFLDQDPRDGIAVGEQWRTRLQERLRWADAMVCVVTSTYLASTWCTAEIVTAQSRGSRLLPLRAEPHLAHPLLTELQHTDLTQDPVAARAALIAALRQIDAAGGSGWPDDRSPFPGLRPFDVDRHRVFFGRTDEIKQLAELVRSAAEGAVLLVVGPSGCGKSSLVRAGLLPVLAGEPGWQTLVPILPGADPVAALARELATTARRIGLQGALIRQADAALADAIAAGSRSRDQVTAGLLRLVTVDEQGHPTRWRVNRAELPEHVVTELNAFVTRRLVTTDTDNDTAVIGVTRRVAPAHCRAGAPSEPCVRVSPHTAQASR